MKTANRSPANRRHAAPALAPGASVAAFISTTWQDKATRIPGEGISIRERITEKVLAQVLPLAFSHARMETKAFLRGELTKLSSSTKIELNGLITGYVRQSGAGR